MITPNKAKTLTDSQLAYALADIREVIEIQEEMARDGHYCPKLGDYWDEFHAVTGEITRRKR